MQSCTIQGVPRATKIRVAKARPLEPTNKKVKEIPNPRKKEEEDEE